MSLTELHRWQPFLHVGRHRLSGGDCLLPRCIANQQTVRRLFATPWYESAPSGWCCSGFYTTHSCLVDTTVELPGPRRCACCWYRPFHGYPYCIRQGPATPEAAHAMCRVCTEATASGQGHQPASSTLRGTATWE